MQKLLSYKKRLWCKSIYILLMLLGIVVLAGGCSSSDSDDDDSSDDETQSVTLSSVKNASYITGTDSISSSMM